MSHRTEERDKFKEWRQGFVLKDEPLLVLVEAYMRLYPGRTHLLLAELLAEEEQDADSNGSDSPSQDDS